MMIDLWLEITIALLALWAVWKSLPKEPNLEWKYFHSIFMATKLRGELERKGGSKEEWKKQIKELVPYHSDGISADLIFSTTDSKLKNRDAIERWRLLYQDENIIEDSIMCDPDQLSGDLQPSAIITWKNVLEGTQVEEFLQRKMSHVIVVGQNDISSGIATLLAVEYFDRELDIDELSKVIQRKDQRLLFVGEGREALKMLSFAKEYPALRDRLMGVILVDSEFDTDWITENFTHEKMDAEANLAIPYLLWSHVSLDQLIPWGSIAEPVVPQTGWRSIEVIDLGAFPMQIKAHQKWMNTAACFVLCKRMELS